MNKHSTDQVQLLYSSGTTGTDSTPSVQIQRTMQQQYEYWFQGRGEGLVRVSENGQFTKMKSKYLNTKSLNLGLGKNDLQNLPNYFQVIHIQLQISSTPMLEAETNCPYIIYTSTKYTAAYRQLFFDARLNRNSARSHSYQRLDMGENHWFLKQGMLPCP